MIGVICGFICGINLRAVETALVEHLLSKKILQFILLTFLITWSVALAAYLLDITYGSILFIVIIAVCYMPAPAYATLILQKLVYRGSLKPYGFTLKNISLRWLLITTVGFAGFIVLGTFVNWHPGKRIRSSHLWQD